MSIFSYPEKVRCGYVRLQFPLREPVLLYLGHFHNLETLKSVSIFADYVDLHSLINFLFQSNDSRFQVGLEGFVTSLDSGDVSSGQEKE